MGSHHSTKGIERVLERAEVRLVRRYKSVIQNHPQLSETGKIRDLHLRHDDPLARRRLVRHFLPAAYRLACGIRGGTRIGRIEAANRAVVGCVDSDVLRPEDDLDYFIARRVRTAVLLYVRSCRT